MGIDLGMTFIDTAEGYGGGYSEEIVARAIEGIRDKVFIATKVSSENLSERGSQSGNLWKPYINFLILYTVINNCA